MLNFYRRVGKIRENRTMQKRPGGKQSLFEYHLGARPTCVNENKRGWGCLELGRGALCPVECALGLDAHWISFGEGRPQCLSFLMQLLRAAEQRLRRAQCVPDNKYS
jgi:hypothetical protein